MCALPAGCRGAPCTGLRYTVQVKAGGHRWTPVQFFSFKDPPPAPTGADIWRLEH